VDGIYLMHVAIGSPANPFPVYQIGVTASCPSKRFIRSHVEETYRRIRRLFFLVKRVEGEIPKDKSLKNDFRRVVAQGANWPAFPAAESRTYADQR
jgi:hypothetical protein